MNLSSLGYQGQSLTACEYCIVSRTNKGIVAGVGVKHCTGKECEQPPSPTRGDSHWSSFSNDGIS